MILIQYRSRISLVISFIASSRIAYSKTSKVSRVSKVSISLRSLVLYYLMSWMIFKRTRGLHRLL